MNFVVSLKVIELQRCTIPHFKALDLLFWPLAWLFTLGLVIFAVWQKTFINIFPLPSRYILWCHLPLQKTERIWFLASNFCNCDKTQYWLHAYVLLVLPSAIPEPEVDFQILLFPDCELGHGLIACILLKFFASIRSNWRNGHLSPPAALPFWLGPWFHWSRDIHLTDLTKKKVVRLISTKSL